MKSDLSVTMTVYTQLGSRGQWVSTTYTAGRVRGDTARAPTINPRTQGQFSGIPCQGIILGTCPVTKLGQAWLCIGRGWS